MTPLDRIDMTLAVNGLIAHLPGRDRRSLLAACQAVPLNAGAVLCEPGAATRHVYFPNEGVISLIAAIDGEPGLEVGMVGREGMLGVHLALGVDVAPLHAMVQAAGSAWRIGSASFRVQLAASPALHRALKRYLYVLMEQMTTSACCTRFHRIEPRLARWLLVSHDRAGADTFRLTHEGLAAMLGVRRVGITVAAGSLQRRGIVRYCRGVIEVVDRAGLEAAACGCYAAERAAYQRVLG
jgi:CRP-like cAMP-binding protein